MNYLRRALEQCGVRLVNGSKWLVLDVAINEYQVWTRDYAAKTSKLLVSTEKEEDAVKVLLKD